MPDILKDFEGASIIAFDDPEARSFQEQAIGAQKKGDFGLAHQLFLQARDLNRSSQRKIRFDEDLATFDATQQGQLQKLTDSFRAANEQQLAFASAPLQTQTQRGLLSAGIEGGLAQSIAAQQQTNLASVGLQAQSQFASDIRGAQNQNREAFVAGEFSFFQNVETMLLKFDLNKELIRFQAQLEADQQKSNNMFGLLGDIGTAVVAAGASFIPGVGPAVSAGITASQFDASANADDIRQVPLI